MFSVIRMGLGRTALLSRRKTASTFPRVDAGCSALLRLLGEGVQTFNLFDIGFLCENDKAGTCRTFHGSGFSFKTFWPVYCLPFERCLPSCLPNASYLPPGEEPVEHRFGTNSYARVEVQAG